MHSNAASSIFASAAVDAKIALAAAWIASASAGLL
jgi:hypothetical protein